MASNAGGPTVVQTIGLTKTYRSGLLRGGHPALNEADFELKAGEVCGLVGPNGAGKTTFIKTLLGVERRDAGTVRILGGMARGVVGYVPEKPTFFEDLSGAYNLLYFSRLLCADPDRRCMDSLAEFGLKEHADKRVREYSKGMKQRLAFARALLPDPKIVLLDEPFSGLDPTMIMEIRRQVKRMGESGRAVLVSSHDLSEIEEICDTVVFMKEGRMVSKERIRGGFVDRVILRIRLETPRPDILGTLVRNGIKAMADPDNGYLVETRESEVPDVIKLIVDGGGRVTEARRDVKKVEELYSRIIIGGG
jgi:ABC-type multidrug transport system ATPase subunit